MKAWLELLDSLETTLGKEAVNAWLRPIKVVRFDAANLILDATPFQKSWFEEHVRPRIKGAFVNNNARPIKIQWEGITKQPVKSEDDRFAYKSDPLEAEFTFEAFLPQGNEIGLKIAAELSEQKTPRFNPILFYGSKGSGKSHLLTAIARKLQTLGRKTMYVKAGTFTDQVVACIRSGSLQPFRLAYRDLDVLIVEDIQIFARKNATQEEFFHTFNALHTQGKQILLSASVPPHDLEEIEPRLISRFEWGVSIRLMAPGKELMREILKTKMKQFELEGDNLLHFFLSRFTSHPLASIEALHAYAMRVPKNTPLKEIPPYLKDLLDKEQGLQLSSDKILKETASYFGIRIEDLTGTSRMKEFAQARHAAVYLCRKLLQMPLQGIGRLFDRDHSTVMSSIELIEEKIKAKEPLADAVSAISKKLHSIINRPLA